MWSIAGIWYFTVTEVVLGFPHTEVDYNLTFKFDMIVKWWMGFVLFPLLWSIMGIYLTYNACKHISQM